MNFRDVLTTKAELATFLFRGDFNECKNNCASLYKNICLKTNWFSIWLWDTFDDTGRIIYPTLFVINVWQHFGWDYVIADKIKMMNLFDIVLMVKIILNRLSLDIHFTFVVVTYTS